MCWSSEDSGKSDTKYAGNTQDPRLLASSENPFCTVSREDLKKEAIRRLHRIGIIEEAIDLFEEDDIVSVSENPYGLLFELSEEAKELVNEFESEYNKLVYLANFAKTEFGGILSLFFVSDRTDEWVWDNRELDRGCSFVYCLNIDAPDFSEFLSIKFETSNGGIKRIG